VTVDGLPVGARAQGDVEGHLTTPALRARAHWDGALASVAEVADVAYDDGRLDAVVDVVRASPDRLRAVWPSCPFSREAEVHVEAHGPAKRVDVTAHAAVGEGNVDVAGAVDLGPVLGLPAVAAGDGAVRGQFHVEARAIDLRAIAGAAPPSRLGASGDVTFTAQPTGAVEARATLDLPGGEVGSIRVPGAAIRAEARVTPGELPVADAEILAREPGVSAMVAVHVAPREGSPLLTFEAEGQARDLAQFERLAGQASGSATVRSTGSIDFGTGSIGGRVSATVEDLSLRSVSASLSLSVGHADARIGGTLAAPSADVDVAGEGLLAGPVRVAALHATGRVELGPETRIRDLDVAFEGGGVDGRAEASLVAMAGSELRVDEASVDGFGTRLVGSVRSSPAGLTVRAKTASLDLGRLGRLIATPVASGTASVDLDATITAGRADGRVAFDVHRASLYGVDDVSAFADVLVHGRHVAGEAAVRVENVGSVRVHSSALEIGPGQLTTPSPWRKTWGALAFEGHLDLSRLAAHLPPRFVPFDGVLGTLDLDGQVARDTADDATPGVDFTLRTRHLQAEGRRAASTWRVDGIDPQVHVTVDGRTGRTAVEAELLDRTAPLLRVDASSSAVPYAKFFSDDDPVAALRETPFDATIDVPVRPLAQLPAPLRPAGLAGNLQAHATWTGTLLAPTVEATAQIAGASDAGVLVVPIDLDLGLRYDGTRADATLAGTARKARVLDATATVLARASDLLSGAGAAWTASAKATMHRLSLRSFGPLYDRQVRGNVSGELTLEGLRRDARARADLTFDGLQVNNVPFKGGHVVASADGRAIDGMLRFEQADGFLESHAHLASRWGADTAPSLDPSQPGSASVVAKKLRAAFFLPFVPASITELDGQLDVDARADIDPSARLIRPQGTVTLRDGTLELSTFGGEFHDVAARVTMAPDGVVRLEDAIARGLSGTVQAAATARFDPTGLVGANADVRMPAKDPLPLVFDGVPMGALDGQFSIGVERAGPGLEVRVDVPSAHVELPTVSASRDAQALGDIEGVQIGVRSRGRDFVPVALDQTRVAVADPVAARKSPVHVAVKLGRDVRVRRGASLDIHLEGQPSVVLSDDTHVSGQIRLRPGSSLDVQGKSFEIESGAVTFVGPDPTNPQVVLTAGWTAPDGTRVYADYNGPLKDAHVRLRSSPAKSQNEILALLLYGSADDAADQASGGANAEQSVVAAAAGGAATQQLNEALGGFNRLLDNAGLASGVATRVDTSQATPRPEVEVQIARDISLQVAWVLGVPPPTQPDTTLLTLDWHFLRKWSLETTVGDQGSSSLNLVWQHRY
jgi:translocation and assembly module TamB